MIKIVFDGPPSHESGRFVEVENAEGKSINVGEWVQNGDYWELQIPSDESLRAELEEKKEEIVALKTNRKNYREAAKELTAEVEEWKGHYSLEREDVLKTVARAEKAESLSDAWQSRAKAAEAENKVLREKMEQTMRFCSGEDQIEDAFDDTEALGHIFKYLEQALDEGA